MPLGCVVPPEIAEVIKRRRFLGYREAEMQDGILARVRTRLEISSLTVHATFPGMRLSSDFTGETPGLDVPCQNFRAAIVQMQWQCSVVEFRPIRPSFCSGYRLLPLRDPWSPKRT